MFKLKKRQCTNCRLCMLACTTAHYPEVQGTKLSRISIGDAWPEVGSINVCIACKEQACINVCPEDALSWDGCVVLMEEKCIQCSDCAEACPVDGIHMHPATGYPLICDTCSGLFSCVKTCPTGAIARR